MKLRKIDVFDVQGVYMLYFNDNIVYCGESICCLTRVTKHKNDGAIPFDDFEIIPSINRKTLERELIIKHRPMFNKQYNPNHIRVIGRHGGRKHGLNKKATIKAKKCTELYNNTKMTVPEIMKKLNIGSKATFYKYLKMHNTTLKTD